MFKSQDALQLIALNKQLENLKIRHDLAKAIGTRSGFFKKYFEQLPYSATQEKAFHVINNQYYEIFGEYRYETYNSFRRQKNKFVKNN